MKHFCLSMGRIILLIIQLPCNAAAVSNINAKLPSPDDLALLATSQKNLDSSDCPENTVRCIAQCYHVLEKLFGAWPFTSSCASQGSDRLTSSASLAFLFLKHAHLIIAQQQEAGTSPSHDKEFLNQYLCDAAYQIKLLIQHFSSC